LRLALEELEQQRGDLFTDQLRRSPVYPAEQQRGGAESLQPGRARGLARIVPLIKAKLVAVESKRITIKDEFLAYTVMPDGRTVSEWLQPQLEDAYTSGKMPPLLPGPT